MPQELRSILFSAEEVRHAVTRLLLSRIRTLRPQQIERVAAHVHEGEVFVVVRFGHGIGDVRSLDPGDVMRAILMYCRHAGIPLPNRSEKRLGVIDGCLSLTTSLNAAKIDPWVVGDRVIHAVSDPLLLAHHRS